MLNAILEDLMTFLALTMFLAAVFVGTGVATGAF